jgi:putative ABC transport system substrate-binding protein
MRIDYRWTGGEIGPMRIFAKELVALQPDVILGRSTPATAVLLQETRTIPNVFVVASDSVGDGFVGSIARPAGKVAGFTNVEASWGGKWIALLKEISPRISHVAVMFNPKTAGGGGAHYLRLIEDAAASIALKVVATPVQDGAEIERAIEAFTHEPGGTLIVALDITNSIHRAAIVAVAARHQLPVVYPFCYVVAEGGLISYWVDVADIHRRAADYVDRVLRGESPADLRCNIRQYSILSSTSRTPRRSACPSRQRCSPLPTR